MSLKNICFFVFLSKYIVPGVGRMLLNCNTCVKLLLFHAGTFAAKFTEYSFRGDEIYNFGLCDTCCHSDCRCI